MDYTIKYNSCVYKTLKAFADKNEEVCGLLLGIMDNTNYIACKCIVDHRLKDSIETGTINNKCMNVIYEVEKKLSGSSKLIGLFVSKDINNLDLTLLQQTMNKERLYEMQSPLCILNIHSLLPTNCIASDTLSLTLSFQFPLKHNKIVESEVQQYLTDYCLQIPSSLLIEYNSHILTNKEYVHVDATSTSWRFYTRRQDTSDYDGISTIDIPIELELYETETCETMKRCIAETCYTIWNQILLFSSNSGIALSQLKCKWEKHVLRIDDTESKLCYFWYDPKALPFYQQLFIAILIPLILYLYNYIIHWNDKSWHSH